MKVVILASGWGKPKLFPFTISKPKCLVPLYDDVTILDYQIDKLMKFNLDKIWIVIGYKGDEIINHCNNHLYHVKYINDYKWRNKYSVARTFIDCEKDLLNLNDNLLVIHCDVIFEDDTLRYLTSCKADICRANNHDMTIKYSNHGFKVVLDELKRNREYYPNNRFWAYLKGLGLTITNRNYLWQHDVDRPEALNDLRQNKFYNKTYKLDETIDKRE